MPQTLNIVAVNGSPYRPSRTLVLLEELVAAFAAARPVTHRIIELADLVPDIGTALSRDHLPAPAEQALQAIEGADLLIVGTPVFRGSLPGLFKHLFDLVGVDALIDKPVLLAATGGSQRHALVIDHQLRPLFSFFQALTLPIGVYAATPEFDGYRVNDDALRRRIDLAVDRALPRFDVAERDRLGGSGGASGNGNIATRIDAVHA